MSNDFKPTNVLIIGGTGTIGAYITSSLLSAATPKPYTTLSLFTRPGWDSDPSSQKTQLIKHWQSQGLNIVTGDVESLDQAGFTKVFEDGKFDTVISCLGRATLKYQPKIIDAAEHSQSVQWFLPSEFGTDVAHNEKSAQEPTHVGKLALRKHIREKIQRLKVTYVVTGPYFDMWLYPTPGYEQAGGFVPAEKKAYIIGDGEGKVGFCTMWDVGKFVTATLRHPAQSFGKALKVQSFIVTPNEVLSEFQKQTGSDFEVSKTPLPEIESLEDVLWDKKSANPQPNPLATLVTLRRIWARGGTLYEKNDNEVLEVSQEDLDTLEEGVRRYLAGGYRGETFGVKA
ncbi:uncharacterized protein B0T23DRAFT_425781 [Neurospora hispaniola]|uniref:NmrA-like domain-containing protein n=1 Tax=Neurospora hispaniola TaxID=588809 RepID=A0AAJ0IHE4_9PEZI|nr:hypothetical protein B0T23DRAFT_425781 [Neurospora hispaniola]